MATAAGRVPEWRKLPLSLAELCIDTTLRCGQSFRWCKLDDEWHCSLYGRVVSLKQDETHLHYRATWPSKRRPALGSARSSARSSLLTPPSSVRAEDPQPKGEGEQYDDDGNSGSNGDGDGGEDDDTAALLGHYFNLSTSLPSLYAHWSASDANFRRKAPRFTGVRILNQDAWESLVAFICSSNNNISRISQMVHKLCDHYGGEPLATVSGRVFRDFPSPEQLAVPGVEAHLRQLGFGYRARYIAETARVVAQERPAGWLHSLRNASSPAWGKRGERGVSAPGAADGGVPVKAEHAGAEWGGDGQEKEEVKKEVKDVEEATLPTYKAAHAALLSLTGVGPKVADCVCLMGLGWGEAVPVDTHVWQIAVRDYRFGGKAKSKTFSKALYDAVGNHFRELWGPYAGWAQSVLFTANLRAFSDRLAVEGRKGKKDGEEKKEKKKKEKKTTQSSDADDVKSEDGEGEVENMGMRATTTETTTAMMMEDQTIVDTVTRSTRKRKSTLTEVKIEETRTTTRVTTSKAATRHSKRRRAG